MKFKRYNESHVLKTMEISPGIWSKPILLSSSSSILKIMGNPHVLVIPYPTQGHVVPLMELSQSLVKQYGFRVTFVNSEFNHKRSIFMKAYKMFDGSLIRLVSIPDGMEDGENRKHLGKLTESVRHVMPRELKKLIEEANKSDQEDGKITCVLADINMGWALEVAAELGIKAAAFWPASALSFFLCFSVQKLIDDGFIDENGTPINKHKTLQLLPTMPAMFLNNISWARLGDFSTQKIMFDHIQRNNKVVEKIDWLLCNSTCDLEPDGFNLAPKLLPIGPVSARNLPGKLADNTTCLEWLDQQSTGSVIYVAFGSYTVFDKNQFQELAMGLELSKKPFLWVVRPDIITEEEIDDSYPKGFQNRVANQGLMVGWAPQLKVLAHPSVACFLSHCGWNSTLEGVSNGVPFLSWPYFGDQFINENYVCDIWKVGLRLKRDEKLRIITREEIKKQIDELMLGDENFKGRALKLKEMARNSVNQGGGSNRTFKDLSEWIISRV